MSVDLSDQIGNLTREINAPGLNQLAFASTAEATGYLSDAFWDAYIDGFYNGLYTEDRGGIVSPTNANIPDFPQELQQLVVFYAGLRIVRNHLRDLKSSFTAKAGTTEYATSQAATVLEGLLEELKYRRGILLRRLSDLGIINGQYIDSLAARDVSLVIGDTYFPSY